jgi:Tol biopolymer transport system component
VQPGTRLGPYEVVAQIGSGGMGEVYRARDTRLDRDVAIKVMPAEFAADPDRLRRFEQEARAVAALNHPNILAIHDVGTHEGAPYIVAELLEGESLHDRLRSGGLPVRKAVETAVQIAHGLAAAHEKGIIHRDLKPANVFVTKDGHVKILDFGVAKLIHPEVKVDPYAKTTTSGPTTEAGAVVGTAGYISPEQLRGLPADHRSDIFALGCVLYEMLSGKPPFLKDTGADTAAAILHEEPAPLTTPGREVPSSLRAVVERCLEKQPDERFQSARDLAFDMGLLSSVSGLERVPEARAVRHPWRRAFALGGGVVVLAGLLVLAAALGRHTARQSVPSFSQLTFHQGYTGMARFAADGETIVYSAAWEDGTRRLYLKRPDAPEALPLDLPGAFFFAVSRSGEVALVASAPEGAPAATPGVLARAPLSGGTPREIVESVTFAEWTPDGSELAVVRTVGGRRHLEFPPGKVLYETAGNISSPRFSPDGERIAFSDHPYPSDDRGSVAVVDRSGKVRRLTSEWSSVRGLAWSPRGDEIWFAASEAGFARALYAVTTAGRLRVLLRAPGDLVLGDVSPAGRAVVAREEVRMGILARVGGEDKERDLTWLGNGLPVDISPDGKLLLFFEQANIVGADYAVCLRRTDGAPPVVLGKGVAYALSPDGAWVLGSLPSPEAPLMLLPIGPGEAKEIKLPGISHRGAVFFPDGRSILVEGYEAGHGARLYRVGLDGGLPRAVTAEGIFPIGNAKFTISPDGEWVAATGGGSGPGRGPNVWLYPIGGGERRKLPGATQVAIPIRWSADGAAVLVAEPGRPTRIVRVDVATGQRVVIKELAPADPLARASYMVVMTPDEKTYAYAYRRRLSELYLVEGLR